MKKILVTGGAGYIGSHALRVLEARRYHPVCFDNLSTGHRRLVGDQSQFILGDLASPSDIDAALSDHVDAVMHFASHALVEESYRNPHKYYHDNIVYALNLLQSMERHGVSRIIFSSSCATYGIPRRVPMTEADPLDPVNPYGMTKLVIERILRDYESAHGMRYVSLRYFNAAGADPGGGIGELHNPETHLIPRLFDTALGSANVAEIYGNDYPTVDGTCVRDYIHVTDLAAAHAIALEYLFDGNPSDVFNLGTGTGYSVLQVVREVARAAGRDIPVEFKPRRPGDPPELVADPAKARSVLGWRPQHSSLEEIIGTAWQWHKTGRP